MAKYPEKVGAALAPIFAEARAAEEATRLAEEATRKAEQARAEGLAHAASRLGGVVSVVETASSQLADRIAESSQGAEDQSRTATV